MKWKIAVLLLQVIVSAAIAGPCNQWNFNTDPLGKSPKSWRARGGPAESTYMIKTESGNRYVAARSNSSGVQLGVEIKPLAGADYTLSWKWRVHVLPAGADESKVESMDSAAAVYAVFGGGFFPKVIKYVWSTWLQRGATLKHPRNDSVMIIVISSGENSIGKWQTVSRNLYTDYEKYFGSEPDELTAIGIKTDSDSTSTSAVADYDDFLVCRNESVSMLLR